MIPLLSSYPHRWLMAVAISGLLLCSACFLLYWETSNARSQESSAATAAPAPTPAVPHGKASVVILSRAQQEAIGLKVVPVSQGPATEVVQAPGQVVPDESRFAYITPRAAGIVRTVAAHVGQFVRAGDLLAMIDSSEVSQARFELYTQLQELELAKTQASWQEMIYKNTTALVERIKAGDSPEDIHRQFEDRPVGANREQFLTAYANYRLSSMTMDRNRELIKQGVITAKQFQQVRAEFESAQATYQGLMDQMDYSARLANARAQQALRRTETAVRVARERLRVLGVRPDGTEPQVKNGHVVGVRPDGSLPPDTSTSTDTEDAAPQAGPILPEHVGKAVIPVTPVGAATNTDHDTHANELPVSAYAIWAPFDGTILDRELIVPGVPVYTTHRIFTLADLSTVWIEVAIHESHYGFLGRSQNARLELTSPAYPGRTFEAEVIYTGDLVDPKSRTVKLLARAKNPDRALKPGMFVDVTLHFAGTGQGILVPEAALLTDDQQSLVFVQAGPERFEHKQVVTGSVDDQKVAILYGLAPGDRVVVDGGFKLHSKAILGSAGSP